MYVQYVTGSPRFVIIFQLLFLFYSPVLLFASVSALSSTWFRAAAGSCFQWNSRWTQWSILQLFIQWWCRPRPHHRAKTQPQTDKLSDTNFIRCNISVLSSKLDVLLPSDQKNQLTWGYVYEDTCKFCYNLSDYLLFIKTVRCGFG